MNAQIEGADASAIRFEINPKLNVYSLEERLRETGRLRVRNFLQPPCAKALYRHLVNAVAWQTFVVSNERLLATPPGEPVGTDPEEEREILDLACNSARMRFACVYDADGVYPEDMPDDANPSARPPDTVLAAFGEFLGSGAIGDMVRRVMELDALDIRMCANRLRPGHFATFHSGVPEADKTRKRVSSVYFHLTPEWKPEWGGMLEYRNDEGDVVEALVPSFNTLDILSFPRGYWISRVAPFAGGSVLAVSGRLYVP